MPRFASRLLSVLLASALAWSVAPARSQTTKTAPVKKPAPKPPVKRVVPPARSQVEISIPYPNAGMYLYRGIYGSFTGGRFHETDSTAVETWKDPIFQWQGEVSYFYTDWFSSGFGFKINSGETQGRQFVENRYFLLGRFHKAWRRAAVYSGINLGVNDVSVSLSSVDTLGFDEPLQETNAAIGLETGGGWKFSKYVGATLGQRVDVSIAPRVSGKRAISFHTQPGLALDMTRVAPSLRESVKALYILGEGQFGQQLTDEGDWGRDFAWIVGISLAF